MDLLPPEQMALTTVVCRFDQNSFNSFLVLNGGPPISKFSSEMLPVPSIAVDFIGWIRRDGGGLPQLLRALAAAAGVAAEVPILNAAAARLLLVQAKISMAGEPTETCLASGMPIINRSPLRQHLRDAIDSPANPWKAVKVIKVLGERGLGRSHSWFLIKFVASSGAATAIKIDLVSATLANQTLEVLFDTLVRTLGITDSKAPSSDGVASDTLAARYADEFAGCLSRASVRWGKPLWLVFDSLDRDLRPEIKRFVSLLARARFDDTFENCVIFLLGPDSITDPEDFGRLSLNEPLGPFTDKEIEDTAARLNQLGTTPLRKADLRSRILEIQALRVEFGGGELCRQVCSKLVDLRIEVKV